jgi:hypothetical protein
METEKAKHLQPESDHMPVLCYIEETWAYFTTRPLAKQWGDDWGDAPYEHNAGPPYEYDNHDKKMGADPWEIVKVAWDGDFDAPDALYDNTPYSVEKINAGAVAWLTSCQWNTSQPLIVIPAGTTLEDFKRLVVEGGGRVYLTA